VRTFKTEEEAIQLANDTTYGLGCRSSHSFHDFADLLLATIYTADIARALRVAGQIEAGTVGINSAFATSPQTPFGGWKSSGYGRESGIEGLKNYLYVALAPPCTRAAKFEC
jgi:aldehyde dehydrogenase (NAD+)